MLRVEGLPRADTRTVEGATVVTIGVFDGMHRGHAALLARLRAVASTHSARAVVLTFRGHPDTLVSGLAPAPLMTLDDRIARLAQAGVDATYVLDFDRSLMEMTAAEFHRTVLIEGLGCVALVFGYDAAICRRREGTVERFRELGLAAERIDRFVHRGHAVSASAIREALTRGELEVANEMLGYAYTLTGVVEHGDARGRQLGFATANVRIPPICMPADGVYAVRATTQSNGLASTPAVANLGTRPTFAGNAPRLEVHVLDQAPDLDLYGDSMTVDFVARIRGERRFSNEAQLADQIATDIASARALLS